MKQKYEVWNFIGSVRKLTSDDPVEIVNWLRARPPQERSYNVHPLGVMFHTGKKIAHDFMAIHREAVVDDIVKKAVKSGNSDGVAQEILDFIFGR